MSLFTLDTLGDKNLLNQQKLDFSTELKRHNAQLTELAAEIQENEDSDDGSEDDEDYFGLPPPKVDIRNLIDATLAQTQPAKSKADETIDHVNELVEMASEKAQTNSYKKRKVIMEMDYSDLNSFAGKMTDDQKTAMPSNTLPSVELSKRLPMRTEKQEKQINKKIRANTKGDNWYNLPATEITEEVKTDLKILQMRSALDPKRFYKKNDLKVLPKYFQIGTVMHSPLDHYSERNTRRNKKGSLVDELLADEQFQKYNKRKYNELMARREKYIRRKAAMKAKKLKKKK